MKIAICDDDKFQREQIEKYITIANKKENTIYIKQFDSGETLLEEYKIGHKFDVVFIDIQMKEINGIKAIEQIRRTDQNVIVVFITSFVQFVSEAFRFNAFQFLIKPITQESFSKEFERIIRQYYINHQKYTIHNKNGITALEIKDIVYIEGYQHQLNVVTNDGLNYSAVGRLNDKETQLAPLGFVRVHQGFLMNMDYIKSINDKNILTTVGITITMSARKKPQVLRQFNKYLLGRAL